jgi:predicted RNase H-like HicB family nuclease
MVSMTIELEREDDGRWIADFLAIPGAMVYGATIAEALENLATLLAELGVR